MATRRTQRETRRSASGVEADDGFVRLRGGRQHNLQDVDVELPRNQLVVFTGVSGSGKSSLAFGTLYAEAERRFLESVAPYARRLFQQMPAPRFDSLTGMPPAIALEQTRSGGGARSSVGSVTTLSNLVRLLYSRVGEGPRGSAPLPAEAFSSNTPEGACPRCRGAGRTYDATEASMVPDPGLTLRERAIAAWPTGWHGQNQRDIVVSLGMDIDTPWRRMPKKQRDWLLFTEEQPTVPVWAGFEAEEVKQARRRKLEPSYRGTFTGARRYLLHTLATTESPQARRRVERYLIETPCPTCRGKKLRREALRVKFAGLDVAELSAASLVELERLLVRRAGRRAAGSATDVEATIVTDLLARIRILLELGLGHLSLDRSTPTLSPGELTRLRLGTQVHSNLFGVAYVLDEPGAGLHPADIQALVRTLRKLQEAGNSLLVVEHDPAIVAQADWIVDVGPGGGTRGGRVLYSGPLTGLRGAPGSETARFLFAPSEKMRVPRRPGGYLRLRGLGINNLDRLDVDLPLGVLSVVTGVSGSGKSSLARAVVELMGARAELSEEPAAPRGEGEGASRLRGGQLGGDVESVGRLVLVDQKPIGRTPRSNLATYTGLFDHVRAAFAATPAARRRRYDAGRFSFNVAEGRCPVCEGEGFVSVELLFLPSVFSPCRTCGGQRYAPSTLAVKYRGKSIAEVLALTVEEARGFFDGHAAIERYLDVLLEVGAGYLRLGQPATELSGGEAQRIKLATELASSSRRRTLYVLDEPTTGLHPSDVVKLVAQLHALVESGHSVLVVEHDLGVVAAADHVTDLGPGAGAAGGRVVAQGTPRELLEGRLVPGSTAWYLREHLQGRPLGQPR